MCINKGRRCVPSADGTCGGFSPIDEYYVGKRPSDREQKFKMLLGELDHWDLRNDCDGAIRAIAGELSWRMVMRIVHKLRRKRGELHG